MPEKPYKKATTKKQRRMAAIAKHHPSKLYKRNLGALKMSAGDLSAMAETKEKGLPTKSPMQKEREKVAKKRRGY